MEMELVEIDSLKSSISIPESVRSQTRSKFEDLLKNALKKRTSAEFNKSSEQLITDEEIRGEDNAGFSVPIPKPRRFKNVHTPSIESGGTYEVTSPKVAHQEQEDDAATYIKSTKSNETVGDILVHRVRPKIPVVRQENEDTASSSVLVVETRVDGSKKNNEIIIKYATGNNESDRISETETPKEKTTFKDVEQTIKYDFENVTAVIIHKTDHLQLNSFVTHPLMVNVHFVNGDTGEYLKKSDESKKYISPMLTRAYNIKSERSIIPQWEETLINNENFNYILEKDNNTIIFFEIVDFVTHSKDPSLLGWRKIAWAFLKPISKDGFMNIDKKVKLQLYKPFGKYKRENLQNCDLFLWWSQRKLRKYTAALHVTVKGMPVPQQDTETDIRSKVAITSSKDIFGENESKHCKSDIKWKKTEHHTSKLPNRCLVELETCDEGAFVVKFSNRGDFLAVAVVLNEVATIKIFAVATWAIHCCIPAHQALIYNIVWSSNDEILLSASADCTVSIWHFTKNSFIQMLPHPSFVYCCDALHQSDVIASGCYDKILRIWRKKTKYNLHQELKKHEGYITSLVFNKNGIFLYSADSVGVIIEWNKTDNDDWCLKRTIVLIDLRATAINHILLCKKEKRIIVHARDSALRVVDLETETVLHFLRGSSNNRVHTKSSLSRCGNFVTCGSDNGTVSVWNIYTEKCVATYTPHQQVPIHDVQFHPIKNVLAFAHYGKNVPVFIYVYDEENCAVDGAVHRKNDDNQNCNDKLDFNVILLKIDQIIRQQK